MPPRQLIGQDQGQWVWLEENGFWGEVVYDPEWKVRETAGEVGLEESTRPGEDHVTSHVTSHVTTEGGREGLSLPSQLSVCM